MTSISKPQIHSSWSTILESEFSSPYFIELKKFLEEEKSKYTIFPEESLIFNAFNATPFDKVKVVLLGQDPYHGDGQANGLCFSVSDEKKPPSLVNIFKELNDDLGIPISKSGNLLSWAQQGVLLLNATLTVRAHQPGSHQGKGWEAFTHAVIRAISEHKTGVVFLLWGNFAKSKAKIIDKSRHAVLETSHPSGQSCYRGFMGCKHFSKTNAILRENGSEEIDWRVK